MCMQNMYRHINGLAATEIFTTRQMLIYGSRSAVDSALSRMVSTRFIVRLARGVFVKDDSNNPTMEEIVKAKLMSFQSYVADHAERILQELSMFISGHLDTFAKYGSSSSFATVRGRAYLKNVCGRKMSLCKSQVGKTVYALWHLGKKNQGCTVQNVDDATANFNRSDRELFWQAGALMPAWLNENCAFRYPQSRVAQDNPFQMKMVWSEKRSVTTQFAK